MGHGTALAGHPQVFLVQTYCAGNSHSMSSELHVYASHTVYTALLTAHSRDSVVSPRCFSIAAIPYTAATL